MQQPTPTEETAALLARLSQRPGVQSTIILSRETGNIIRSTGLLTREDASDEQRPSSAEEAVNKNIHGEGDRKKKGTRNAEDVARIVWKFVKSCEDMIEELNGENDEAKLLRIRTKKNELVIVPDSKFLLVAVHDTAPA